MHLSQLTTPPNQALARPSTSTSDGPDIPTQTTNRAIEVHSLVCHRHVDLYRVAITSLLRHAEHLVPVVHDDGSLTRRDTRWLRQDIGRITVIDAATADAALESVLGDYPNCARYRRMLPNAKQVFDFALIGSGPRLMALDSDTLFFDAPTEILTWLSEGGRILHAHEYGPRGPDEIPLVLRDTRFVRDVNIGLLCYPRTLLELDRVEECLAELPSFNWWTGQLLFAVLLADAHDPVNALPPAAYVCGGATPDANVVFRHYFTSHGMTAQYEHDLRTFARRLGVLLRSSRVPSRRLSKSPSG